MCAWPALCGTWVMICNMPVQGARLLGQIVSIQQSQVFRAWRQGQQQAASERLLQELQLMHIAQQHHRKVFSQHSFRAWVEGTACRKEDAAAQARKQETWNKVQGWLAESNLGKMSNAPPPHETASSPVRHAFPETVICAVEQC